jgi:hypothetical protein
MTNPHADLIARLEEGCREVTTGEQGDLLSTAFTYCSLEDVQEAIAALSAPVTVAQAMSCPEVVALVEAALELFYYASYAEIVGGVSVNRPQIRLWGDKTLKAIRPFQECEINATIGQDVVMQDNGKDNANADN